MTTLGHEVAVGLFYSARRATPTSGRVEFNYAPPRIVTS